MINFYSKDDILFTTVDVVSLEQISGEPFLFLGSIHDPRFSFTEVFFFFFWYDELISKFFFNKVARYDLRVRKKSILRMGKAIKF